jgi:AcrR family transcriptional regulator
MIEKHTTRPRMSSLDRRSSIVEAAIKLFAEKGFRGTTTRELAAAVGVTEPVLYEHFKTKRDLYAAIIDRKSNEGLESLTFLLNQYASAVDDRGFFQQLGEMIIAWYTEDPTFVRLLLFSNLEGGDMAELFHERSARVFHEIVRYIQGRMDAGALRTADATLAARAFFGMVAHYALTGMLFGCWPMEKPPKKIVSEMVDIYLAGICAEEK